MCPLWHIHFPVGCCLMAIPLTVEFRGYDYDFHKMYDNLDNASLEASLVRQYGIIGHPEYLRRSKIRAFVKKFPGVFVVYTREVPL